MSYSGNQVKNPNGKLAVSITKADIYNTAATYENIIVKMQIGNEIKMSTACPYSQKNLTWADNYEVIRRNNEDNFVVTLINKTEKKGEEVIGTSNIEINQFMQRARKMDFQADLQLNGKNSSSLALKIQFTKFTDAENMAQDVAKAADINKNANTANINKEDTNKKLQDGFMNEASKKLKENELNTNYVNKAELQNFKFLITITNIKATFARDTDVMSKMDPYIRFRISEESNYKTTVINGGGKTPEWKEEMKIPIGLEELIVIQALDSDVDSDDLIGSGLIKVENLKEGNEIKNIPIEFEKKKVGELIITMNCQITPSYEKKTNLKGKIIIRNINTNLKSSVSNSQFKFTNLAENRCTAVNLKGGKISQWSEDIIILPIKDKTQTQLLIALQSVTKKAIEPQGSCTFELKDIIEKEKWYIQEQIPIIGKDKKENGFILADIQYVDFAEREDEKLYRLQKNEGIVHLSNMRAYLTRDTDTFGKMDPYCVLNYNNVIQRTETHKSGGKEPNWKNNLMQIPQFTYQKDRILKVEVSEEDVGKDDLVGNGQIDLSKFVEKKGKYLGQKVEIYFEGKSAGQVYFDLESEENKELIAYLEKKKKDKELEEIQKKKLEEEMRLQKLKQEEEDKKKKLEEDEKKKKLEDEKRKKEEEDKKKKDEEDRKKKEEEDKKKKEDEDKKKKDEEEKKKKKLEEDEKNRKLEEDKKKQQSQLSEMELKKQNEEKEKKRIQDELEAKKKKDDEEKRKQEEQELLKKKQEEERQKKLREEQRQKEEEENQYQDEQFDDNVDQQKQQQSKTQEDTSNKNYSPNRTNKVYSDYNVAFQNLQEGHGFGMSEYQSATSLQKSSVAFSMPKSGRFNSQSAKKRQESPSGPDYVQLPSIFETNPKKGTSFGVGKRNSSAHNNSPGPGSYQDILIPRNPKGYTFGVSRSDCKNYIKPNFGSPQKQNRFESAEKQQYIVVEQQNNQVKQNRVYIDQNRLLAQQHQQQKRNGSLDQRKHAHLQPRNHSNLNKSYAVSNNPYIVYSNPRAQQQQQQQQQQNNYHFSNQPIQQKNNQSYFN